MTNIHTNLTHFLQNCCCEAILKQTSNDSVRDGTHRFSDRLQKATAKEFTPAQLPVMSELERVIPTPLTLGFDTIAPHIKWRPSPRTDPSAEVIALSSINEMLNLDDVVAGLMFMTPKQIYPEHQHSPQEVYLVLSGTGDWLYGGNQHYSELIAGNIIYNHPNDMHGMKSYNEPILALYFLWGDSANSYRY